VGKGPESLYQTTVNLTKLAELASGVTNFYNSKISSIPSCTSSSDRFDSSLTCTGLSNALKNAGGCPNAAGFTDLCKLLPLFNGDNDDERIGNMTMGPSATVTGASLSSRGKFVVLCFAKTLDIDICVSTYGGFLQNNVDATKVVTATLEQAKTVFPSVTGFLKIAQARGTTSSQIVAGFYPPLHNANVFDVNNTAGLKAYLKLYSDLPSINDLGLAWAVMAACSVSNATECSSEDPTKINNYAFAVPTAVPDTVSLPACVLIDLKVFRATNTRMTPFANCTYTYLLDRLGSVLSKDKATVSDVLGAGVYASLASTLSTSGLSVAAVPAILKTVAASCSGVSWSACSTTLAAPPVYFSATGIPQGIPADFNTLYPTAAGAFLLLQNFSDQAPAVAPILAPILSMLTPPTFSNFLKTLASESVSTLVAQNGALLPAEAKGLVALIPVAQFTKGCSAAACFATSLYPLGYAALQISPDRAIRIVECLNNDKDISAFKTAQSMVTAAAVMMGLGMAAGFAALAVDKGPVAFGAGALSAIGGVLVVAALMVVKGAPVYSKIGGAEVAGKPLYSGASGQLIAIVGGLLAIIGGITQAVSGCLNKAGSSSDQLTTKVENTY